MTFIRITFFSFVVYLALCVVSDKTMTAQAQVNTPSPESLIVLRDLSVIRNNPVKQFDAQSIQLSDGSELSWDRVLKANISSEQQAEFDNKIRELGLPLFRLKSRIANRDWNGAIEVCDSWYRSDFEPSSNKFELEKQYLICLTKMRSSLQSGHPESALVAFLQSANLQTQLSAKALEQLGDSKLSDRDCQRMFSSELMPIWFDSVESKAVAAQAQAFAEKVLNVESASSLPPGIAIYLASLKVELATDENGNAQEATDLLRSLTAELDPKLDSELNAWRSLIDARLKLKQGKFAAAQSTFELGAKTLGGSARPAALYFYGVATLQSPQATDHDLSKAMLSLLKVPAIYDERYPTLSAAAIFQASKVAEKRGRPAESQKLTEELLSRYIRTYHGRLARKR
jgi:hypothetical protein